jgi:hypothetical protein
MIDGARNVVRVPVAFSGTLPPPTADGASIDDESNGPAAGRIGVATVTFPTETDTAEAPNDETPDTTKSTTTNTSVLND